MKSAVFLNYTLIYPHLLPRGSLIWMTLAGSLKQRLYTAPWDKMHLFWHWEAFFFFFFPFQSHPATSGYTVPLVKSQARSELNSVMTPTWPCFCPQKLAGRLLLFLSPVLSEKSRGLKWPCRRLSPDLHGYGPRCLNEQRLWLWHCCLYALTHITDAAIQRDECTQTAAPEACLSPLHVSWPLQAEKLTWYTGMESFPYLSDVFMSKQHMDHI